MSDKLPNGGPAARSASASERFGDGRLHAPATARNRAPIAAVLAGWLPARGRVLELASGTGEHALHFAARFPGLVWQPSDPDAPHRASIAAHRRAAGTPNLRAPLDIDVTATDWPLDGPLDAIVCCNMIHIAPWVAAQGLFAGAGRYLEPGGGLFLYGPFKRGGVHTAPSNEAFDASLRANDPAWGLRDLEAVTILAEAAGLAPPLVEAMPANNLSLWFVKRTGTAPVRQPNP
jgi:SAM-dependent methyltransferase